MDHDKPDIPAIAKEVEYWQSVGKPEIAADVLAKHQMTTVSEVDPNTQEVRYRYVRPSQMGGASQDDNIPVVGSAGEAAKLPPGSKFRPFPGGPIKMVPGGASPSNGSGRFPRPY